MLKNVRSPVFAQRAVAALALAAAAAFAPAARAQTEPAGGQPAPGAKASVADLDEQRIYQRAFEAVVWSQPAVSIYGSKRGLDQLGIGDNVIDAMSRPLLPRHEFLTANNNTPYITATTDLRKGPVVLVVPPASDKGVLYGQVVDAWQETIAGVGPSGADKGKGGSYLFLPPGYTGEVPAGHIAVRSPSYRIYLAFRSVRLAGMSDADAHAYAQTLKMHPLSEPPPPKSAQFADSWDKPFHTLPYYDFRYFHDLHAALVDEPVRPRDKAMMGVLHSLGIEPGKPFDPPLKYKAAMERGVVDAYFYMQGRVFEKQSKNLFYPDRHWSYYFLTDAQGSVNFDMPDALWYTQRSDMYHVGIYYAPKIPGLADIAAAFKEGRPMPATVYLFAVADKGGKPLEAGALYKLRVPADMPVKQFWSLIIYDYATWAFIYSPQQRVGLSSYDVAKMKKNADGSVDIYFGPEAPVGLEANWIPTEGKKPAPFLRIYDGDARFWSRSFTMPDVERVQ